MQVGPTSSGISRINLIKSCCCNMVQIKRFRVVFSGKTVGVGIRDGEPLTKY